MAEIQLKKCPVSKYCGACQYQGISYEKQLNSKQKIVEKLYSKYEVKPIIGANNQYHYRNKSQVSFEKDINHIYMGNYVTSTHKVVDIEDCQLVNEKANEIFNTIKKLVIKHKISIFDETYYRGFLRHVLIRNSYDNKQYMVVLVAGNSRFSKKDIFIKELLKKHPEISTIILNINNRKTSMVLGNKDIVLYGKGYIEDVLFDKTYRISNSCFFQVNHEQCEKLYKCAIELGDIKKDDIVLDAYCGIGTITLELAEKAKKVIGVEINKESIKQANENSKRNNIDNVEFYAEDAAKYMKKMLKQKQHFDVVVVDPPRNGLDNNFIYSLIKLLPDKIIYISCNPKTQKDDIKKLSRYYKIDTIQPVDMFPLTEHVEAIVLLCRVEC